MSLVCIVLEVYLFVVLIRVLMSWIPPTPGTTYATIYEFFDTVTEPVLGPVRRLIGPINMGAMRLDLSPIVVFIGGQLLIRAIC